MIWCDRQENLQSHFQPIIENIDAFGPINPPAIKLPIGIVPILAILSYLRPLTGSKYNNISPENINRESSIPDNDKS